MKFNTLTKELHFTKKNYNKQYLIIAVLSLSFFVNPLISLVVIFAYIYFDRSPRFDSTNLLPAIGILLACFIGCINSTKITLNDPDLTWYLAGYKDAGQTPLWKYLLTFGLTGKGREIAFPLFNYIIYQFVGNNDRLYVFIHSTVCYVLLNSAVVYFCRLLKLNDKSTILVMLVMTLTPYIFTMSAILLRQFLSGSLLMYITVMRIFYQKSCWILILTMILIHSSTLFFIPFLVLPFFKNPISNKNFHYYAFGFIIVIFIQQISSKFLPFFSSSSALGYALERASKDTTFVIEPLTTSKILVALILGILPIFIIHIFKPALKRIRGISHFFNILLVLVFFIIANLHQAELSVRFNFYIWLYFPFVLAFLIRIFPLPRVFHPLIFFSLLIFFILYLEIGVWRYRIGNDIFSNTFLHYIL